MVRVVRDRRGDQRASVDDQEREAPNSALSTSWASAARNSSRSHLSPRSRAADACDPGRPRWPREPGLPALPPPTCLRREHGGPEPLEFAEAAPEPPPVRLKSCNERYRDGPLDPRDVPKSLASQVWRRDGFRCRFCSRRLVPTTVFGLSTSWPRSASPCTATPVRPAIHSRRRPTPM